jgi:hypothetical protein
MNKWILEHTKNPFLTKGDEDYFMTKYGLTRRQVKTACNNRRQRIIVPVRLAAAEELEQHFMTKLTLLGITISLDRQLVHQTHQ